MARTAAARRYARALFSIAGDEGRVEEMRAELGALGALIEADTELRNALFRPLYPAAQRRAVLEAILGRLASSTTLRHFCNYLVDQRRIVHFAEIAAEYGRLADEAAGRVPAHVRSAGSLSDEQQERLRRALCDRTGRDVQLEVEVDESLVGGLVAQVGDLVFDGSVRSQLHQLRRTLAKEH